MNASGPKFDLISTTHYRILVLLPRKLELVILQEQSLSIYTNPDQLLTNLYDACQERIQLFVIT